MEKYLSVIRDALDGAAQSLWSYVLGLSPDEIELYFLALFSIGCILSIWLIFAIHRRGQPASDGALTTGRVRDGVLPPLIERARPVPQEAIEHDSSVDLALDPARSSERSTPAPAEPELMAAAREERSLKTKPTPLVAPAPPRTGSEPAPREPPPPPAPPSKESLLARLRNGLAATRGALVQRLDALVVGHGAVDDAVIAEIEDVLISSDVGVRTTAKLLEVVRKGVRSARIRSAEDLRSTLKDEIERILSAPASNEPPEVRVPPRVVLVVGVNGTGKTTSIGKLARRFQSEGLSVMLGAADTFRAAAIEQLEVWGQRSGIPVIRQGEGADPGAVAYDALQAAKARGIDLLIVDTAGRMHTKKNLMEEIRKVKRVLGRDHPGAPHEVLLVLDATTGQNAISQAHLFHEALELSGIVLTKLDGTAKGGVIIGICDELKVPVRYIGIGEAIEDLRPFDAREFVDALFG